MNLFPEEDEEIEDKFFINFDTSLPKTNLILNSFKDINSREKAIISVDKNINLFPLNEFEPLYEGEKIKPNIISVKKRIFSVVYPLKDKGNESTQCMELNEDDDSDSNFKVKKRSKIRQCRFTYKDLIEQKIKRNFFNGYLVKKLNAILKSENFELYFKKFPKCFTNNVSKTDNSKFLLMTLGDIIKEKVLYKGSLKNYEHNLKVLNEIEKEKTKINDILLNKTFNEEYEDYLDSNEYKIKIEKIKQNYKGKDEYIKKYICLSKHFLELFQF